MTKRQVAQHKPRTAMTIGGPLPRSRPRAHGGLAGLLASVSISAAALALATLPQQARAQSAVNATPTGVNATVTQSATFDQVIVSGSQATVDWALNPTGVSSGVFLNGGTTLDFQGSGSYTVLNRVNPMTLTGTLALNGSVTSSSQGKIWFYNPGGWVVGSGASIDVGSLVLTSSPITESAFNPSDPNNTGLYGPGGTIRFGQALAGSSVTVQNGAIISARQSNSYVALVAPRVVQAGLVMSNGSTAYVGAGAADITINNGLFDIVVTSGTDDTQGVVHTGTTSGIINNSSSATPQGIYLVAVPKNDALTMLVSGNLGYNSASSASQIGGKIVLSAGYGIKNGSVDPTARVAGGSIKLTQVSLASDTVGKASNAIDVAASNATVGADGNLSLAADQRIGVIAFGEGGLFVNGALALSSGAGANGGLVDISVDGAARFQVGGNFDVHADGLGAIQTDPNNGAALLAGAAGESATGGNVKIALGDAYFSVLGQTRLSANALRGLGGASVGGARAGTVSFSSTALTTLSPVSKLNLEARADASTPVFGAGSATGGGAIAGSVDLAFGGSLEASSIFASSHAEAYLGQDNAAQNATAGAVSLTFSGALSTVKLASATLVVSADAANGGLANAGTATLKVDGARVNAPIAFSDGDGGFIQPSGSVSIGNYRNGSGGTAGAIGVSVVNGGSLDLAASNGSSIDLFAQASAVGGGTATGAAISLTVDGGTVNVPSISIESDGQGAFNGPLSNGRGGDITVAVRNGGGINASSGFSLYSSGTGGNGTSAGDGTGGTVALAIANGRVTASSVNVASAGFAGNQFAGGTRIGTGLGGSASISLTDPGAVLSTSFVNVLAPGQAGRSEAALAAFASAIVISGSGGGNGSGGTASVIVADGLLDATGGLTIDASGDGGDGFGGGTGGSGSGGTASLTVNGGTVLPVSLMVRADGRGGRGSANDTDSGTPAAAGGAGTGGNASLLQSNGTLNTGTIVLTATGNAPRRFRSTGGGGAVFGDGPATGGTGGLGQGGTTSLAITGGSLANISGAPVNSISLDSRGVGGTGGNAYSNSSASQLTRGSGGTGRGGTSTFVLGGGTADFTSLNLDAFGSGGASGAEFGDVSGVPSNGGNGGSGFGGNASITLGTSVAAIDSFDRTRSYSVSVGGRGENGGSGVNGGAGGAGQGGNAQLRVSAPGVFVDQFNLDAYSYGGDGGSSGLGNNGGAGGTGTGGTAQILVDGGGVNFTAVNGLIDVSGEGGFGGTGGSGQVETLDAAGNGGNAGAGFGGTVRFSASNGATLDLTQLGNFDFYTYGSGGSGGNGGNAEFNSGTAIGDGGNGGDGTGGSIEISASDGTVRLGTFVTSVNGDAGSGGGRLNADGVSTDASNGGSGGSGFGGNVSLTASGFAGSIQADSLDIHVDGFGGSGVAGQGYDPVTFVGASGGAGRAGTGGTIRLDALNQGTISVGTGVASTLTANGSGAFGGIGANGAINPTTGAGGAGGKGGNSGQGNGGTVTLNAEGGLIETGDINVFVNGTGNAGANGGAGGSGIVPPGPVTTPPTPPAPDGASGARGDRGSGVGGAVYITAQRDEGGSVGGLDLGAVRLDLTGFFDNFQGTDISGLAEIRDAVDDSNGGVNFTSLDVAGRGDSFANPISLSIYSQEAPIRIANNLGAGTGGNIDILAIGTGGLEIGGQVSLGTDSSLRIVSSQGGLIHAQNINFNIRGQTLISAQNCTGPLCSTVRADDQFLIFSDGDIGLLGPALIEAGGFLQASSRSNVTGAAGSGYRASSMFISAENDVTIRNASGGGLDVEGGLVLGEGSFFVNGNVTLGETDGSGVFDLARNFQGLAGTSIDVLAGTTIGAGNAIRFVSGDDIRIGAGATLTNTTGGTRPGFIELNAGGLVTDGTYPAGNVPSLLIGRGVIVDGTGGSVMLSGGAIDARGAIFRGADFTADVVNPPAPGVAQRNDNGQLTAPCLEGNICLGGIAATGAVRIGQGTSAPVAFTGTGNIVGASVAITSRNTLTYGAVASPFTINATGPVSLTSQSGDIALTGTAFISGGTVALSAARSITGNGRLFSAGDVGIDVGTDITLAGLTAGRQLTTVGGIGGALEASYSVPGSLSIGTFQVAAPTVIRAGGSISIDNATTGGNDLDLIATTLVSLIADNNVANLRLVGRDVAFATINASGNIVLSAGNAIVGTSAVAGGALTASGTTLNAAALQSAGAMSLTTSGATTLGTARAGTDLTIRSGALSFTGLTSTGATSIVAASVAGGNIAAGTSLATSATGALAVGTAAAGTTLTLDAQTIAATTLRSGGAMALTSAGTAQLGSATSGGALTVKTGDLTFANLTSTGATQIDASNVIGGDIAAGTTLAVATPGAIRLGTATAGSSLKLGGVTIQATTLRSGGATSLTSSGATTLGTATSGSDLTIRSAALSFTGLTSTGATSIVAASVAGGDIVAGTSLTARATGALVVGTATTGTTLSLNGATLGATTLRSGGAMALTSAGAARLESATSGADLTVATGDLTFATLSSVGATQIDATSVNGGDIAAGTTLAVTSPGAVKLGTATAGRTLTANVASLTAAALQSGGAMRLTTTGAATLVTATSGADLTIASGALSFTGLTSTGATSIDAASVAGGNIAAGTTLAVTSPGAVRLGTASAASTLALKAANLNAAALQSGGAMTIATTDAATLGTATTGADLAITSGALAFTGLTSTGATTIDATSIAGGNIAAGTSLAARASGALALDVATAGTTLSLDGATLKATTLRSAQGMTLTSAGTAQLGSATSGGALTVKTGDLTFANLTSTGATQIDASNVTGGDIAAGTTLAVATPGAIRLGTATAGSSLTLGGATIQATTLRSGGATSLTSSSATTLGTASAGTTFTANAGALQFTGITATGDVALAATTANGGDVTSTAGAIRLGTSSAATVGQLRAATDVTAQATTLTFAGINAGRNVTLDVTTLGGTAIVAGQDLTIRSVNDLTFGTIAAGRNLSLNASSGAITVNTDIDAGGTVSLAGDAILIKAVGPLTVATVTADNGDISISTDGLLRVSNAASRGDVTLTSTANSLILGPIVAGRAPAVPLALNPSGTSKGTPGPGAITLSAAQSITMQGTVDALTALSATAGTLIDQRALAVGKTIAYRSADLTLGQTAALGQSNFTTGIALTNTGSTGALLGDVAGTTAGYRLDNAEFGRIHSGGDVSLAAGSSLAVGALTASAASGSNGVADGNIGATGTLALVTTGDLSVGGALALNNAAGNTLRLTSGSLTLGAEAGSVRLVEGSGHGGTLAIATGELSALTSAARTAIVGMDGNAINLRLAQNDGVSDGRTLLEAGTIAIAASGRVLIQNTALGQSFDARRGFVADSFAISTSGGTQSTTSTGRPLIVINGTVAGTTGLTALRLVQVTGGYDDLSTVNGCRLFTATCGTPQFDPLRDLLEDEIGRGSNLDSGDAIGEGMLILIDRFEPLGFEAVIDEPVTGSGNDDFLVPEAGTGDQQCEDDDKTKCDKPPAG